VSKRAHAYHTVPHQVGRTPRALRPQLTVCVRNCVLMIAMRERHICVYVVRQPHPPTPGLFWSTESMVQSRSAGGRAGKDPLPGTIVHTQLNRTRDCPVALDFTPDRALQPDSPDSPPERSRDPHSPSWGSQVPPRRGRRQQRFGPRAKCARATPVPTHIPKPGIGRIERGEGGWSGLAQRDGTVPVSRTSPLLHPCQPSLALGATAHLLPH